MNIVNCFHTLTDLDLLSEDDWSSDSLSDYMGSCYFKQIFNFYDEISLEISRRLREQCVSLEIPCSCTAVTVAETIHKPFMERLSALGFQTTDLIRLSEGSSIHTLSSEKTAALLCSYMRRLPSFDFIFTGMKSDDGGQGKVPYLLAEYLGIRCISNVIDVKALPQGGLHVVSRQDFALREESLSPPALLLIGEIPRCFLHVPTLRQKIEAKNRPVSVYKEEDLLSSWEEPLPSARSEPVRLLDMEVVRQQRHPKICHEADSKKAALKLLDYYRKWS